MFKRRMVHAHMRSALAYGKASYARRLQVGAVIVDQTTDQPVAIGWNGTAPGAPNVCDVDDGNGGLVSVEGVIHAEINAMNRLRTQNSRQALSMFVSDSPCPACAAQIVKSGIKQVFFCRRYRLDEGIKILLKGGIELFQVEHDTVSKITMCLDDVAVVPAQFDDKDILVTNERARITNRVVYGLKNYREPWLVKEVQTAVSMLTNGASAYEIAAALDRSIGSIIGYLNREGIVSFYNGVGVMRSTEEGRVLWCTMSESRENTVAIESLFESMVPEVHEYMDTVSSELEDVVAAFRDRMAPYFIKVAYNRKK
ncbi:dCMP deaminase [Serratia phage phiMAM1]|uniref:Putative deoxycytidylate deaminase n=1 Tax=Serratia phage phiMAM1 TaxID=1262513 RepID=K7YIZ7_9CAUD|nr:dCMP deaminase [Serratia phage phiMAM1]AFX93641.1 putative deoxycytidylate deaminase [Serratia phage phiMAM1]